MIYVGQDNGTTGLVGVVGRGFAAAFRTPTRDAVSYFKTKTKFFQRVDWQAYAALLRTASGPDKLPLHVVIEKPFSGSAIFKATEISGARADEAFLIVIELLTAEGIPITYEHVPSTDWQSVMLPGVKTREPLKKASLLRGMELFGPVLTPLGKLDDADGLLIAEWARRTKG